MKQTIISAKALCGPFICRRFIAQLLILLFQSMLSGLNAQTGSWQLWASGLPGGVYPRLAIGPDHSIYYGLMGGGTMGVIYKSNTSLSSGSFSAMPAITPPASVQNNIVSLVTNASGEPIVGMMRNTMGEPWIFHFDNQSQQWITAVVDTSPTLGAYCSARGPDGTIWIGAKWSYVYKSTDGGNHFNKIDESASIAANYPCYYPSWYGVNADAAIYGINVDGNGRVYAGTESAGIVYSDDNGSTWHPADFFACQGANPALKDSLSPMRPVSQAGNAAGIGFSADNTKLIFNGTAMWTFNYPNTLACADMVNHTVQPVQGLPQALVTTGQQVTRIVTACDGTMYLYSGGASGASGIGVYTSTDGVNWSLLNTGITGALDNQTQGGLAVDSNAVYLATHDGKIFRYLTNCSTPTSLTAENAEKITLFPNPAKDQIRIHSRAVISADATVEIFGVDGKSAGLTYVAGQARNNEDWVVDVASLPSGMYILKLNNAGQEIPMRFSIIH